MALRLWRRWGAQPFDLVVLERSRLWRWRGTSAGVVPAETARPAARDSQARHREGQGTRVMYGSGALSALSAESVCHEGQMLSPRGTTGIRRGTA